MEELHLIAIFWLIGIASLSIGITISIRKDVREYLEEKQVKRLLKRRAR